jgi:DnaJ like chaperone protein
MGFDKISGICEPAGPGLRVRLADALDRLGTRLGRLVRPRPAHQSAAFTAALVALAAKMAKADGVAVRVECEAFQRFLEVSPEDMGSIRRLYDLASQDTAGFETYAADIASMLKGTPDLKINVLECLLMIACSDGILHPAEEAFLEVVAKTFGLSCDEFKRTRALFVRDASSPYEVLGVAPGVTTTALKKRYYELVQQCHPDRLIATGAQAALIKAANAKLAAINAAYEAILAERQQRERALGESA